MDLFLQQAVNGLALGANYALIALGFAIVYGVLRMINFAHGNVLVFGVFVTLYLMDKGSNAVLAVLAGMATGAGLAALVERVAYRPLRRAHPMMPMLTAIASGLLLLQLTELIFGLQTRPFPQVFEGNVTLGSVQVSGTKLFTLAVAIVLTIGLTLFLRGTRAGKAIILMRQDLEVAGLMGIGVNRMISVVYAIGGLIGVVGGLLAASTTGAINPQVGLDLTIVAFVAAILGGLGSLPGAVVGGLALGVIRAMSDAYISTSYSKAVVFGVLIVVLLLRPGGIVNTAVAREVRV